MKIYSNSTEIDFLEAVAKYAPHSVIEVIKLLKRDQFPRKMITPIAVIHADPHCYLVQA